MNNGKLNKWAALLAFIGGMAALPLSDTHAAVGDNRLINTATTVIESGTSYRSSGNTYAALQVTGNGAVYNGTDIILTGTANTGSGRFGAYVYNQGQLVLTNGTISTSGTNGSSGVMLTGTSSAVLDNINITTEGNGAFGVRIAGSSTLTGRNIIINTTGDNAGGVYIGDAGSRAIFDGLHVVVSGSMSSGAAVRALSDSHVDLGRGAHVETTGAGPLVDMMGLGATSLRVSSRSTVIGEDATIISAYGNAVQVEGNSTLTLTNSDLKGANGLAVTYQGGDPAGQNTINIIGGNIEATDNAIFVQPHADGALQGEVFEINITGGTVIKSGVLLNNNEVWEDGVVNVTLDQADLSEAGGIVVGGSNSSSSSTEVTINGGSGLSGDVGNSGSGSLSLNLDNSSMTGDVTNGGDGKLTVILDNGSNGTGGFNGGDLKINDPDSRWGFDKDSTPDGIHNNGTVDIGNNTVTTGSVGGNGSWTVDVDTDTGAHGTIATGTSSGEHTVIVDTRGGGSANPGDVLPGIVADDSGNDNWSFQNPIDWGLDEVIVGKDDNGDWLVERIANSQTAAVLTAATVIQQNAWFAQQNSLLKRMGELRFNDAARDGNWRNGIWLRTYGQFLDIDAKVTGQPFKQMIYGADAGIDHAWTIGDHNTLWTGLYIGSGISDADFRHIDGEIESDSIYGGLYLSWLNTAGWHADLTLKLASLDNDLSVNHLTADYRNRAIGGSLELGRRLDLDQGWFLEPQLQVNYLRLLTEDYTTSNQMNLRAADMDAWQLRAGTVLGRTLRLANGGALQPYAKLGAVQMLSTGGTIRNGPQHARPNLDGTRAELGLGVTWQIGNRNQLHFDYEVGFGEKYDKPWGLTAGFRHQF